MFGNLFIEVNKMDKKAQMIAELKEKLGNPTFDGKEIPKVTERFWTELANSSLEEIEKTYLSVMYPQVYEKFRQAIPVSISNEALSEIIWFCHERVERKWNKDIATFMEDDVHIEYREDYKEIWVYQPRMFGISWFFDMNGENTQT
jgi:hypothetical protein